MLTIQQRLTNLGFNKTSNRKQNNISQPSKTITFGFKPDFLKEVTSEGIQKETGDLFDKALVILKEKALPKLDVNTSKGETVSVSINKKYKGPYFVTYQNGAEKQQIGIWKLHNYVFSKLNSRAAKEHKYGDLNDQLQGWLKIFIGEKN